jgi:hypothetical protein
MISHFPITILFDGLNFELFSLVLQVGGMKMIIAPPFNSVY